MLTLLLCGAVLFAVGAVVVAAGSARALRRLGIDPMRAALWLGLAEAGPERLAGADPRVRPRTR